MSLFEKGKFHLYTGRLTNWRIDTSAFDNSDWECIANLIMERHPNYTFVKNLSPRSEQLAEILNSFSTTGPILLVDDVLQVEEMHRVRLWYRTRADYHMTDVDGFVIFACLPCPQWVRALWQLDVRTDKWESPLD